MASMHGSVFGPFKKQAANLELAREQSTERVQNGTFCSRIESPCLVNTTRRQQNLILTVKHGGGSVLE